MTKEQIQEAAEQRYSRYENLFGAKREGFETGVEWLLANLWRPASETPEFDGDKLKWLIIDFQKELFEIRAISAKRWDDIKKLITRWMYVPE